MKKEYKEVQIHVKIPNSYLDYSAVVRDGEVASFDEIGCSYPDRPMIEAYITFLKEILEEI